MVGTFSATTLPIQFRKGQGLDGPARASGLPCGVYVSTICHGNQRDDGPLTEYLANDVGSGSVPSVDSSAGSALMVFSSAEHPAIDPEFGAAFASAEPLPHLTHQSGSVHDSPSANFGADRDRLLNTIHSHEICMGGPRNVAKDTVVGGFPGPHVHPSSILLQAASCKW